MFQTSIDTGTATFQPTVDLLEAIRQALIAYATRDTPPLH